MNTGAMNPAREPSMLSWMLRAAARRKVKLCKNQTTSVARKITVKALWMKSLALSHICRPTLRGVGSR